MTWIEGYNPTWISDKNHALETLQLLAPNWIGRRLDASYVGWFEDDTWYSDLPVILIIGGLQYEFCWTKMDELAITQGQLQQDYCVVNGQQIRLQKDAMPELQKAIGKEIIGIELGESEMSSRGVTSRIINSINFIMRGAYLSIYNCLDENCLSDTPCKDEIQINYPITPSR